MTWSLLQVQEVNLELMVRLADQDQADHVDLTDREDRLVRVDNREGLDYLDQVVSGVRLEREVLRVKEDLLDLREKEEVQVLQVINFSVLQERL